MPVLISDFFIDLIVTNRAAFILNILVHQAIQMYSIRIMICLWLAIIVALSSALPFDRQSRLFSRFETERVSISRKTRARTVHTKSLFVLTGRRRHLIESRSKKLKKELLKDNELLATLSHPMRV